MENTESRYKFRQLSTGFEISGDARSPVQIHLDGPKITVLDLNDKIQSTFGLYSVHKILGLTSSILMKNWEPPKDKVGSIEKTRDNCKDMVKNKIKTWAKTKTSKALGKRFAAAWRDLLKDADPTAIAVQKAIFAATQSENIITLKPEFYNSKNQYVIKDIINYRAAAIAATFMNDSCDRWSWDGFFYLDEHGYDDWLDMKKVYRAKPVIDSWQKLYACNRETYTSLNKTLTKLPGGIPVGMLQRLTQINLKRPITTRLELLTLLETQHHNPVHLDVIYKSSRDDIKRALMRYASHIRIKPNFRKTNDIIAAVNYILDYPNPHNGNFNGLAEKSIRWHRDRRFNEVSNSYGYTNKTKNATPPIHFPANPHITFLDTVGSLIEESNRLNHCVRNYCRKTVLGTSFIFHVDYQEEHATVEVDSEGRVVQARGPWNKENKASKFGAKELSKWGKKFPGRKIPNTNPELELAIPF